MTHRLFNWIRQLAPRGSNNRKSLRPRLILEPLEERALLASSVFFSMPVNLSANLGGAVNVPVTIDHLSGAGGDSGLSQCQVVLNYDPMVFTVSSVDIVPGSLLTTAPASGNWTFQAVVHNSGGIDIHATANAAADEITSDSGGVLANITLHVKPSAPSGNSTLHVIIPPAASPTGISSSASDHVNHHAYVLNAADQVDGIVNISAPSTLTVRNTSSNASVVGSLPSVIAQANADTTGRAFVINFDSNVFQTPKTIKLVSTLNLSNTHAGTSIIIDGPTAGVTIAGRGKKSNFSVLGVDAGTTAILDGLTISRGFSSSNSGGGINNHGTLTLNDVTLRRNTAQHSEDEDMKGGGIFNARGAVLTLNDCTLERNKAFGSGGAIFNDGVMTVNNSIFTSNSARAFDIDTVVAGGGGAIFNNSQGLMTVNNSDFLTNHTPDSGGAIGNQGTLAVIGSNFVSNKAGFGGAIDNDRGTATATVRDSTISFNRATIGGGLFSGEMGHITVVNSTVALNTGLLGGGIFNLGNVTLSQVTVAFNRSKPIFGAEFSGRGGGIADAGTMTLFNTIVADNSARLNGDIDLGPYDTTKGTVNGSHNLVGNPNGLAGSGITDQTNGNLVGHDALLATLGENGGSTQTIALLSGSPAFGAGGALTTLAQAASSTDTTLTVTNVAALASTAAGVSIRIGSEEMTITGVDVANHTITVTRGVNGVQNAIAADDPVFLFTDQRGVVRPVGAPDIGAFEG